MPDAVEEAETALKKEALSPPPNTPEEPQNDDNDVDDREQTPAHYVSDNEAEAAVAAGAEAAVSAAEASKDEDNWQQPKVSDVSLKITSSLSSIKQ